MSSSSDQVLSGSPNRGLVEFLEALKLDVTSRNDLLGAAQEHKIKTRKSAQTNIDEVILGTRNEPEYRRLQNNEFREALRVRTVKINVPSVTRLKDEIRSYEKDFHPHKGKDIAPHTIKFAAMWAAWRGRGCDGGYVRHQPTEHPGQDLSHS